MLRKKIGGFTLVEVLVSVLVAGIAIVSILQAYRHFSVFAETSRQNGQAMGHLLNMMERIRATPRVNMEALFPDGVADGGGVSDYAAMVGGYVLDNEQITVSYLNPGGNPLQVVVTLAWVGPQQRPLTRRLTTLKAS